MSRRLMPGRLLLLATLLLMTGVLAGCSRDVLYSHLDEQQANEVVAALINHGVDADKKVAGRGDEWQVMIDHRNLPTAMSVLHDSGLPRRTPDIAQMFKKQGIVSSPIEDKQRFIYAREQELGHTLRQIDGVVSASVYLSIPDKDPLSDKQPSGSASVWIIARPNAGIRSKETDIKAAVMSGTEGLTDPSRVTVQFFTRDPGTTAAPAGAVAGDDIRNQIGSWLLIGFAALAMLLAALLLWRNRNTLLRRRVPNVAEYVEDRRER